MKRLLSFAALIFISFMYLPIASSQAVGNSITISPAQLDIELGVNDTERQANFTIGNSYNVPVILNIELKGIDQQSGRIIPSDDVDQGLISSVRLSQTELTIPEQSTATISLVVTNPSSLSPGGHYGTIVFTQRKSGDKEVSLTQAISAGLFVVKRGGQLREVDNTLFKTRTLPYQIPSSAQITIKNVGNVHVIPRASILVYTKNGSLVAKGVANTDSRRVLPGRAYEEKISLSQVKRLWWPQKLRVVLEYRADNIEEAKHIEKSILYIPSYVVPAGCVVLLLFVLLVRRKTHGRRKKKATQVVLESLGDEILIEQATPPEPINLVPKTIPRKSKKRSKKPKKISVDTLET